MGFATAPPPASGGNVMIELLEQQKKLTANQWKLICTANLADLLDFFDFFLIGYVAAALTKQWSLTYWEGGAILRFCHGSRRRCW
jgi:MFS transporter, putative metabolite:H+ symporter